MKIGKLSESALKRSVLKMLKTNKNEVLNGAGIGEDCAILAFSDTDRNVMSAATDTMALATCMKEAAVAMKADMGESEAAAIGVTPVFSMKSVIQKCANNLAAGGAIPIAAMITLLLPETAEECGVKALMSEAEKACAELSMQIAGGQTRVTESLTLPFAVVTGYGKVPKGDFKSVRKAAPGQDIVISKWIGLEGTAMLAKANREKLLARYPAYLVEQAEAFDSFLSVLPEAATATKSGVCAMHDASEGGIFAALWELAEGAGVGLTIDLKKLPLRQETVEVCECCNVNPYELLSGGCLVMTTEDGPGLVAALEAEGIPAVIVGRLTDSNDRLILNEDEVRYMDRPKTDEIYQKDTIKK